MKTLSYLSALLVLFLFGFQPHEETTPKASNDFIVKSGETKILETGIYQFDNVTIEPGGKLIVQENNPGWFVLWVTGDVTIQGTIEAKNFKTGPRLVSSTTPDNTKLEHAYLNDARGGNGGYGGQPEQTQRGSTPNLGLGHTSVLIAGKGAGGTSAYGGGGGHGGYMTNMNWGRAKNDGKLDAKDWRGAVLRAGISTRERGKSIIIPGVGGNGGQLEARSNGGLVFIYCEGTFNGAGGTIDLSGNNGENGLPGIDGNLNNDTLGSGGGGGGAPGGEGGRLILVSNNLITKPAVNVRGGLGGQGGKAGLLPVGASDGQPGEKGRDGSVHFVQNNEL